MAIFNSYVKLPEGKANDFHTKASQHLFGDASASPVDLWCVVHGHGSGDGKQLDGSGWFFY
jgi:hypothetical protein